MKNQNPTEAALFESNGTKPWLLHPRRSLPEFSFTSQYHGAGSSNMSAVTIVAFALSLSRFFLDFIEYLWPSHSSRINKLERGAVGCMWHSSGNIINYLNSFYRRLNLKSVVTQQEVICSEIIMLCSGRLQVNHIIFSDAEFLSLLQPLDI